MITKELILRHHEEPSRFCNPFKTLVLLKWDECHYRIRLFGKTVFTYLIINNMRDKTGGCELEIEKYSMNAPVEIEYTQFIDGLTETRKRRIRKIRLFGKVIYARKESAFEDHWHQEPPTLHARSR